MNNIPLYVCVCVCVYIYEREMDFPGDSVEKNMPSKVGLIPGSRRSPGEGNDNAL